MSRPPLSREVIVDAAVAIVCGGGGRALTMRRLAADLGVATTAIYWHVPNRAALVEAVVEQTAAAAALPINRARTPATRVERAALHFRRTLLDRPHLLAFLGNEGRAADVVATLRDACLGEFLAAGQAPARAVRNARAVVFHVVGFVLVEQGVGGGTGFPTARSGSGRSRFSGRPEVAEAMVTFDHDAVFAFTLRAIVRECLEGG